MEFEWDEGNTPHATRHGLTPYITAEVGLLAPQFFINEEGLTGTHIMIGPHEDGRFWTIVLIDLGDDRWRPIAGWRSDSEEMRMYWQQEAGT